MNQAEACFRGMVHEYAELETQVQRTVGALCGAECAACTSRCCTPDVCEEALTSAFLTFLRNLLSPDAVFTDQFGWQGVAGCDLAVGRPPVCYDFYCREIRECFALPREQYLLQTLGRLMGYVGEAAVGDRALTAIRNTDELRDVDTARVRDRIACARTALAAIRTYMESGTLDEPALAALARVATLAEIDRDTAELTLCDSDSE